MTRKAVSLYMAATCAMVIASPGRFACGIVIALELWFLMAAGTLFRSLLKIMKLKELKSIAMCTFIVSMTMIFRELIVLFMPVMALQLSFVIYLPAISTFSSVFLFDEHNYTLKEEFKANIVPSAVFSIYIVFCALIRDVFGYGTITLPAFGKMFEKVIISSDKISSFSFLATVPGALVMSALIMALYLTFEKRVKIIEKAGI